MLLTTSSSRLSGSVQIPASKSHTVRAVLFAAMADGESVIRAPLVSQDTLSAVSVAQGLGAEILRQSPDEWRIRGHGPVPKGRGQTIDVGNSGTSLYIGLGVSALVRDGKIIFDGDEQIRRRTALNLLTALRDLGARPEVKGGEGCCPIVMRGTLKGGSTTITCPTSQYLTSLLMCTPFAERTSDIHVPLLYEQPYVEMTLQWLHELGVSVEFDESFCRFSVPGGQEVQTFDRAIPADFSSATFFLCAAAITGSELLVRGLDMDDAQGDKAVVDYLRAMGARITQEESGLRVHAGAELAGVELDLNETPDALPAMAVTACFARGRTVIANVPQARLKETDRIAVMANELSRLGVQVVENEDGLEIEGGGMDGGQAMGHGDHRVVMAFAIAGLAARGEVTVSTAEAADITFPGFADLLRSAGGEAVLHG